MSQTWVDITTVTSGKLIVRGCVVGRMFIISVPVMINTKVAPVSITAWVSGIAGILGGMTGAHTLCCHKRFAATTVFFIVVNDYILGGVQRRRNTKCV